MQPNATYEPLKRFIHENNAQHWQKRGNPVQLIAESRDALIALIKREAKIEEASDEDVLASLNRIGYRPAMSSADRWYLA